MLIRSLVSDKLLLPFLLRFSKDSPWQSYENLIKLEWAERASLCRIQMDNLRSIIAHAEKNVPYYAETFARAGVKATDINTVEDLLLLPTINKRQISANFPDRITSSDSNRDDWRYFSTSGTTDRLMVIADSEVLRRDAAIAFNNAHLRGTYAPGSMRVHIPPDACSLACAVATKQSLGTWDRTKRAINGVTSKGVRNLPRRLIGGMVRSIADPVREMASFGPEGTRVSPEMLELYLDQIQQWQPAVLSGLPTYLQLLARHIRKFNKKPPVIGSLLPMGALSTPGLKRELAQVFGVPVHEEYGGHEFGNIASSCEQQDKLHIAMSECLVEVVRDGKHVPLGEVGEIVVTVFSNRAMPLIRYRPGDVGRLYEDYCACGRRTQLLTLEGRIQNTIITSRGIITEQAICDFMTELPDVEFSQLVQRSATNCDLLVVGKDLGIPDSDALAAAMADFLGEEMNVRPCIVSTIKPEDSGKFRFVKSTSHELFHKNN
jgi:phenylacetate-CoA ligase